MKEENLTNQMMENEPEQADSSTLEDTIYTSHDVYEAQSNQDIYSTPDVQIGDQDTGGLFSGNQAANSFSPVNNAYAGQDYNQNPYGSVPYENSQNGSNPYGNPQDGNNQYGNTQNGNNPYENVQYGNSQNGNNPYENVQYGNSQNGNNPYGNAQNGNNQYGNAQYGNNQYGNAQYGNSQYGNSQYGNAQYGSNPYGNAQYGNNPYGNSAPYSPYAMPQKKKNTGLIIGVGIAVVVLFFIALFALFYHIFETISDRKQAVSYQDIVPEYHKDKESNNSVHHDDDSQGSGLHRSDYDDDNDHDSDHDRDNDEDDWEDDYDYDSDEYYTLHDDVKNNLSYSIEWDYYEYDPDDEDVLIMVDYPVVVGSHVPNLDTINEAIENEVSFLRDFYFDEYANYMYDDDSYFGAYSAGYVTYMSEDILSIVFSEYVYSDYFDSAYLYCFNIDMRNGVILDNTDIISVDDDFSVDFRVRSDRQNGTIKGVDRMTDQEITELLTSSNSLIIYYTPQGMEIGFNYDEGWVSVTYSDYKDFLKIF